TPRVKEYVPQRRSTTRIPTIPEYRQVLSPSHHTAEATEASPQEHARGPSSSHMATSSRQPEDPSGDPGDDDSSEDTHSVDIPHEGKAPQASDEADSEDTEQLLDYSGTENRTPITGEDSQEKTASWLQLGESGGFEGENVGPDDLAGEGAETRQEEEEVQPRTDAEEEVARSVQPETSAIPAKSFSSTEASHTDATQQITSSQAVGPKMITTTVPQLQVTFDLPPIPPFTSAIGDSARNPVTVDATPPASTGQASIFAGLDMSTGISTGFRMESTFAQTMASPQGSDTVLAAVQTTIEALRKENEEKTGK